MKTGHSKLWDWFGLSYASWLTLPRVLMHEMPDDWQERMADLLREFDDTWDSGDMPQSHVSARRGNRYAKWPSWLLNYRHPDKSEIEATRKPKT